MRWIFKNEDKKMLLLEKHKQASTVWCRADAFGSQRRILSDSNLGVQRR